MGSYQTKRSMSEERNNSSPLLDSDTDTNLVKISMIDGKIKGGASDFGPRAN